MITVLGVLAVILPIGLLQGVAKANGGGGSQNQVTIQPQAEYSNVGTMVNIGLYVKCQSADMRGIVVVSLTQTTPQTPYGTATGTNTQLVVCDGQTHSVAVSVTGVGFDAGTAWATAEVDVGPTEVAYAQRWINIVVVNG